VGCWCGGGGFRVGGCLGFLIKGFFAYTGKNEVGSDREYRVPYRRCGGPEQFRARPVKKGGETPQRVTRGQKESPREKCDGKMRTRIGVKVSCEAFLRGEEDRVVTQIILRHPGTRSG